MELSCIAKEDVKLLESKGKRYANYIATKMIQEMDPRKRFFDVWKNRDYILLASLLKG